MPLTIPPRAATEHSRFYTDLTPRLAFKAIEDACADGVPIVPLIGAGLSVESGVPTTPLLTDYFAKVRALIEAKRGGRRRRRPASRHAPDDLLDDDTAARSVYRNYLLSAGWPDLHRLNDELLAIYARACEQADDDDGLLRRIEHFNRNFAGPAGGFLGGLSIWAIHSLLRQSQPALIGLFSPDAGCPVVGAMRSLEGEFVRAVAEHVSGQFHDRLPEVLRLDSEQRTRLSEVLEGSTQAEGLRSATRKNMDNLRGRVLMILRADWRAMMRSLTDGDPTLADALFDRLVRAGRPSEGHQVLALLTESLGWNLWLTTNFDTLIEQALRAQGIEPVVFELQENGPVPDARLLRDAPSVVKLHGGSFALRVGESLDVALAPPDLSRFVEYFPDDALVLVLGYGGGDRRVMSLIEHLASRYTPDDRKHRPKVLWVYRDAAPPPAVAQASRAAKSPESVAAVRYRSGGLFLRELHARLVGLHPAGCVPYTALPMVPPFRVQLPADAGGHDHATPPPADTTPRAPHVPDPGRLTRSVTILFDKNPGASVTSPLAELVRDLDGSHQSVWCELDELPGLHALVAHILCQITRFDPDLTPRTFIRPAGAKVRARRQKAIKKLAMHHPNFRLALRDAEAVARPLARRFAAVLRRGKYVVALDSVNGFGRDEFSHDNAAPPAGSGSPGDEVAPRTKPGLAGASGAATKGRSAIRRPVETTDDADPVTERADEALWQTLLLYAFLKCVAEEASGFAALGQSKLCAAVYPLETPRFKTVANTLFDHVKATGYFLDCVHTHRYDGGPSPLRAAVWNAMFHACSDSDREDEARAIVDRIAESDPRLHQVLFEALVFTLRGPDGSRGLSPPQVRRDGDRSRDEHHLQRAAWYWAFLEVASAFRRPRSRINMIHLATKSKIFRGKQAIFPELLDSVHRDDRPDHDGAAHNDPSAKSENARDITFSDVFRRLDAFQLLIHSEGGFYWMQTVVRNTIYRDRSWPLALGKRIEIDRAELHEAIADEYNDLLTQSESLPALFEVAYHLFRALRERRETKDGSKEATREVCLVKKLTALVERWTPMLTDEMPARVLPWFRTLHRRLGELLAQKTAEKDLGVGIRKLRRLVRERIARVKTLAAQYDSAAAMYLAMSKGCEQRARLGTGPKALHAAPKGGRRSHQTAHALRVREAYFLLECGHCKTLGALPGKVKDNDAHEARRHFAKAKQIANDVEKAVARRRDIKNRTLLRQAREIQIKSLTGAAELDLLEIEPWAWHRLTPQGKGQGHGGWLKEQESRWKEAERRLCDAEEIMHKTPELFARDASHLNSRYWLLKARLLAYDARKPRFREVAFRELDRAKAVTQAGRTDSQLSDLADVRLQAAEILLLSARATGCSQPDDAPSQPIKAELESELVHVSRALEQTRTALADGRNDDIEREHLDLIQSRVTNALQDLDLLRRDPGPAAPAKAEVKADLDRAAVALDQARATLLAGRPDVQRWTRFGLLQTYLRHAWIMWEVWTGRVVDPNKTERPPDRDPAGTEPPPLDPRCELLIQEGLVYLGQVELLCYHNPFRQNELRRLWLQLLSDFLAVRRPQPGDAGADGVRHARQDWYRWNDVAGLPFVPPAPDPSKTDRRRGPSHPLPHAPRKIFDDALTIAAPYTKGLPTRDSLITLEDLVIKTFLPKFSHRS